MKETKQEAQSMDHCEEVAKYARIAEEKRLVTELEGNLSVLDRQTGRMYITPSRQMKLLLEPEDVCIMEGDAQVGGRGRRSSEYRLHEAVYAARSDVNAVLHCHVPFLTAYAVRYQDFVVPETCSLREVFPRLVCLPFGTPGTHEIHRGIEEALRDCPICLLGGHGVVCASRDPADCIGLLDAAEGLAKTLWLAKQL